MNYLKSVYLRFFSTKKNSFSFPILVFLCPLFVWFKVTIYEEKRVNKTVKNFKKDKIYLIKHSIAFFLKLFKFFMLSDNYV